MVESNASQFIWPEKYRPKKVEDVILPPRIKGVIAGFVAKGNLPNMVLHGGPGVGKTTIAKAALDELGCHYFVINGSLSRGIDTIRDDIYRFASTMSHNRKRKYVILDEADNLTHDAQLGLRGFMEEFADNCGFILTCNYKEKLIAPIAESRVSQISFDFDKSEKEKLSSLFYKRVAEILKLEGVEFDPVVVARVITTYFPDWRRVLTELQTYSSSGKIDTGILAKVGSANLQALVPLMKAKKFTDVRQWVADNKEDPQRVINTFAAEASQYFQPAYIPTLIIILGEYQYKAAFVRNQEINMTAMFAEIMSEAMWK